jgi:hypothetical protein
VDTVGEKGAHAEPRPHEVRLAEVICVIRYAWSNEAGIVTTEGVKNSAASTPVGPRHGRMKS